MAYIDLPKEMTMRELVLLLGDKSLKWVAK